MADPKDAGKEEPDASPSSTPTIAAGEHAFAATIASGGNAGEDRGPVLSDDEVVAGRYRVQRYIARGGMGEVYQAEDLELGEPVALKTIRELARDALSEERFKREIQLSRKVTHPNVCRIFDVGYYDRVGGERVMFLTMELLAGETLLERVKRDGALPIEETAVIVRQIVAGLTAAHAARVVHRDLKSANVMLVPKAGGGSRAVVTDFGLAHVNSDEGQGRTLSGSGGIVGTPGYMAPEQVEGGELSDRTDVYALGVVMYEMLTGQLPFDGATPLSIAAKRLTMQAPSPRKLRPDLPAKWERAVLSCMRRSPSDRPQSARAVLALLDDDSSNVSRGLEKLHRRAPLVRPLSAAFIALLALAVGFFMLRDRNDLGAALRKRGVTLGQFDAADTSMPTGFEMAVRNALRVELMTDLPVYDSAIDVSVPGAAEAHVGMTRPAPASKSRPFRIDAKVSVGAPGEVQSLDVWVRVFDPDTNEQRTVVVESGGVRQLADVVERVGERLRVLAELPQHRAQPLSAQGAAELTKALELGRRADLAQELEVVEAAMIEDPDSVELRFVQARALAGLQLDFAASVAAARTVALGPSPDPFWAARAEALSKRGDAARSAELLQALRKQQPNNLDLSIDWAMVLVQAQRDAEAADVLHELAGRRLSPRDQLRVAVADLGIAEKRSRTKPVLAGYEALVTRASSLGLFGLATEAQKLGCSAVGETGSQEEAEAVCGELERKATASRRSDLVLYSWSVRLARAVGGNIDDATRKLGPRCLALAGALGSKHAIADVMSGTGILFAEADDEASGFAWIQEAIAFAKDVHDHSSQIISMNNLAYYKGRAGDVNSEIRYRRESLDLARDIVAGSTLNYALCSLGLAQLRVGKVPAAARLLDECVTKDPEAIHEGVCAQLRIEISWESNRLDEMTSLVQDRRARARKASDAIALANADLDECDTSYRTGAWAQVASCKGSLHDTDDPKHLLGQTMGYIADIHLGKPAPSLAVRAELAKDAALVHSYITRSWVQLALLDLERTAGTPPSDLLPAIDKFIDAQADKGQKRLELYARYQRLQTRVVMKPPTLRSEVDELVELANQGGFTRLAADARRLAPR